MHKRSLMAAITTMFLLCVGVNAQIPLFFDVTEESHPWAVDPIEQMAEKGIIKGYPDGDFQPDRPVTKQEAMVLISRVLGFNEEDNIEFVEQAKQLYLEDLSKYSDLKYPNEVAFLLYKNVILQNEIDIYIGAGNALAPLKRYEAAVLVAKTMSAEELAKNSPSPDYVDVMDIPAAARPYVTFVSDLGIMGSMHTDVKKFEPMFDVNRAQISVFLYRLMQEESLVTASGIAEKADTDLNILTVSGTRFRLSSTTKILKDGYPAKLSDIILGSKATITSLGDEVISVEIVTILPDETIEGMVASIVLSSKGNKMNIANIITKEETEYSCPNDVVVTYEGNVGAITDIKTRDHVYLQFKNGKLSIISAYKPERTLKGTVTDISLEGEYIMTVVATSSEEQEYSADPNVLVKRNGLTAVLRDVVVGDKVDCVLKYNLITDITATSKQFSVDAELSEITISATPALKVRRNGKVESYALSRDAVYDLEGQAGTIYDLRLGATVKLDVDSETVTKVTARLLTESAIVTGTVESVNTSYGFFTITTTDASGNAKQEKIFPKKVGGRIIDSNGRDCTIKDIVVGSNISATGQVNLDAFEATTIIVMSKPAN